MSILVTGAAGFIGFHVAHKLLTQGKTVIGVDNLNTYYDVGLKKTRLQALQEHSNFHFELLDISDKTTVTKFHKKYPSLDSIIHLAAQAGVRYSLVNPYAYSESNLTGHLCLLELARATQVKHFVYASSSSVYGANTKLPFSIQDTTDTPISLYAATKKACELMSYSYSHLYNIPSTGLRFFTVYGPWGRPDMAAYIFTKAIFENKAIALFNHGNMRRNFTYIDDIVQGILSCLTSPPPNTGPLHRIYNLGNNRSESLLDFVQVLEHIIGKKAQIVLQPMQPGDVKETIADISESTADFGFTPHTNIQAGLKNFVAWYKNYYKITSKS